MISLGDFNVDIMNSFKETFCEWYGFESLIKIQHVSKIQKVSLG